MKIIDARGKSCTALMKEFLDSSSEKFMLTFDNDSTEFMLKKDNIKEMLFSDDVSNIAMNCNEMTFKSDNAEMTWLKSDYDWWNKTTRRKNKLFNFEVAEDKKEKQTVSTLYQVSAAFLRKDSTDLEMLTTFVGTKEETINFMNEQIEKLTLSNFSKGEVVFCFCYDKDKPIDLTEWNTISELSEMGVVSLK